MTLAINPSSQQYLYASVTETPIGSLAQQTTETITYAVDYSQWLAPGETVVGTPTFNINPSTTPALSASLASLSGGTLAFFQLSGGTDATRYAINVTLSTSTGQSKTDTFFLQVSAPISSA